MLTSRDFATAPASPAGSSLRSSAGGEAVSELTLSGGERATPPGANRLPRDQGVAEASPPSSPTSGQQPPRPAAETPGSCSEGLARHAPGRGLGRPAVQVPPWAHPSAPGGADADSELEARAAWRARAVRAASHRPAVSSTQRAPASAAARRRVGSADPRGGHGAAPLLQVVEALYTEKASLNSRLNAVLKDRRTLEAENDRLRAANLEKDRQLALLLAAKGA